MAAAEDKNFWQAASGTDAANLDKLVNQFKEVLNKPL